MKRGDKIRLTEGVTLVKRDFSEFVGFLEKGTEGTFEGTKGNWSMIRVNVPKFKGLLIPILGDQIELAE